MSLLLVCNSPWPSSNCRCCYRRPYRGGRSCPIHTVCRPQRPCVSADILRRPARLVVPTNYVLRPDAVLSSKKIGKITGQDTLRQVLALPISVVRFRVRQTRYTMPEMTPALHPSSSVVVQLRKIPQRKCEAVQDGDLTPVSHASCSRMLRRSLCSRRRSLHDGQRRLNCSELPMTRL